MFTRDFWRAVAIRTGAIYVQAAVVVCVFIPLDEVQEQFTSFTLRLVPFAAAVAAYDIYLALKLRRDELVAPQQMWILAQPNARRAVVGTVPMIVAGIAAAEPGLMQFVMIGAMAAMSAINPLLGVRTLPPVPEVTVEGQEVIDQRHRLAEMALQEPQVSAAGLNEDERGRLRAEIEEEIEREAASIARATGLLYQQYIWSKERAQRFRRRIKAVLWQLLRWFWVYGLCGYTLIWLASLTPDLPAALPIVTVAAAAAATGLATVRRTGAGLAAGVLFAVAMASVTLTLPPATSDLWRFDPADLALFAMFGLVVWFGSAVYHRLDRQWQSDAGRHHPLLVESHELWVRAMFETAVLRIVSAKMDSYVEPSYSTTLPPASVDKLGDITELTQFVPTETSARLIRMTASMPSAAIGLSGPRGVGKSTVLRVLSDFRSNARDLGLILPAPTSYDPREFLTHLFTRLCLAVLPDASVSRRFRWPGVLMAVGLVVLLGATFWPSLPVATGWVRGHVRELAQVVGSGLIVAAAGWLVRRPQLRESPVEELARQHLRTLRYLETQTVTRTGAAKTPFGDLGGSRARQRAEVARTFPELVDDFRTFLEQVGLSLRGKDARVVICIDELDKIGTPEQAEKFLNDIKAIFRVRHSFFLVSVSEDALTSFSRRALAVRTTFDTAFDAVVEVGRFSLADTRALLVQQVIRLPEPFVWFCHCLSGGLPRDLGRIVRGLYDVRAARDVSTLPELAAELVRQDVRTVTQGQLSQVSGRADAGEVLGWTADVLDLPMVPADLVDHCGKAPDVSGPDLSLLVAQCCAHLRYSAAVLEVFCARLGESVSSFRVSDVPVSLLAKARSLLSVDPGLAERAVSEFQAAMSDRR